MRESPAGPIIKELEDMGANIHLYDPVVLSYMKQYKNFPILNELPNKEIFSYDVGLILTHHDLLDLDKIAKCSEKIVDTRGCLNTSNKVIRS